MTEEYKKSGISAIGEGRRDESEGDGVPVLGLMTFDPKYVFTVDVIATALPHWSITLR